jgi:hypothetical protein
VTVTISNCKRVNRTTTSEFAHRYRGKSQTPTSRITHILAETQPEYLSAATVQQNLSIAVEHLDKIFLSRCFNERKLICFCTPISYVLYDFSQCACTVYESGNCPYLPPARKESNASAYLQTITAKSSRFSLFPLCTSRHRCTYFNHIGTMVENLASIPSTMGNPCLQTLSRPYLKNH